MPRMDCFAQDDEPKAYSGGASAVLWFANENQSARQRFRLQASLRLPRGGGDDAGRTCGRMAEAVSYLRQGREEGINLGRKEGISLGREEDIVPQRMLLRKIGVST